MKNKTITLILFIVFASTIAIALAPIGVTAIEATLHQKPLNYMFLLSWANGDTWGHYFTYIGDLTGSTKGLLKLAAWILVFDILFGLSMLAYRATKPKRTVTNGILGDAKLIDTSGERRSKNDFWSGFRKPQGAGLVLSAFKQGYLYDSSVPHALVIGKTGSGKSQFMDIPSLHLLMEAGWNIVATGKTELVELTGDKALEEDYQRIIFDLGGYPGASGFNPLDLICHYVDQGSKSEAQKTARQTAADLIPLAGGNNDYFPKAARSALTAIILIVAYADIPYDQKNMASVSEIINKGTTGQGKDPSAPLKDYIRSLGSTHPAFSPAADFLSDGGTTTAGKNVLSTLKEAVSIFSDEGIARITAKSDYSMFDMINNKTIIYVHLLEEGDPYMTLFTSFFNQYWRVAQQIAGERSGKLPFETAILGDEWGNLGKVDCLGEIVTLGRSMRLHMYAFVQNLKQLNKYNKPGDEGAGRDKLLGSMGIKVALSLGAQEDAEYFTRLCGKRTMRTRGMSEQHSQGARNSSGQSYNETAVDLIKEWEWKDRIPSRDGSIVAKSGENSAPGREGVFQMPLTYANKTPAGKYFELGNEAEESLKRANFRLRMEAQSSKAAFVSSPWCPNFAAYESETTRNAHIEDDEFSAWDEVF